MRRGKRLATTVLVMVVCTAVLLLTFGVPTTTARETSGLATTAAAAHVIVVRPSGHDDTANLQGALNACASNAWTCTIQLVRGTYYMYQVTAVGFTGTIIGAGEGSTIIQAEPNLPSPNPLYNSTTSSFWNGPPGPSNPWPALFTFVGGSFEVSGVTFSEPYFHPSLGYYYQGAAYDALVGVVIVTSTESGASSNVHFDHVAVFGAPGDSAGFNLLNGIDFEGLTLVPGGTTVADLEPLSGSLSVTNSAFVSLDSGPWFANVLNGDITVCFDSAVNSADPFGFFDTYGSVVTFCGNRASDVEFGSALFIVEGLEIFSQVATTVSISGNYFQVSDGSTGVLILDFTDSMSATVTGNVILTDTSCGCYSSSEAVAYGYSAISLVGLASVSASGNVILGGGAAGVYLSGGAGAVSRNLILGTVVGVWVDYGSNIEVVGNQVLDSADWGISVTDGSSYIAVAHNTVMGSGSFDLYWDGTGTGNVWLGNMCKTSNPPGLC